MATAPSNTFKVPPIEAQTRIIDFTRRVLTEHKKFNEYLNKMEVIDVQYARYQANVDSITGIVKEQGVDAATTPVGVMNLPSSTPPVVIAQVDSLVGYLSEVFLSGYPLFPVVSSPADKNDAEKLETLMDDHATLGGYARELLMFLRDGVKYNFSALEVDWCSVEQYTALSDFLDPASKQKKVNRATQYYNHLKRLDPYNTIWDHNLPPGEVSKSGDYAGYVEVLSRMKMKRFLQKISDEGECFNTREALKTVIGDVNYHIHPQISNYISARKPLDGINWFTYITGKEDNSNAAAIGDNFEKLTLYARIIPKEFGLYGADTGRTQIWKFVIINNQYVVQAKRIISAYDYLPVLFGQPLEDGLGFQTQSIAESSIPYQVAAGTLFNIRFNAARRAVSDRALYDPDRISSTDINAPVPAGKIPVKSNNLAGRPISDAYHQIPFDPRGTDTALQDAVQLINFSKDILGLNNPRQGQFQKGNKSVQEWNDTMSGGESRLRLPALTLEFQVFMPLKNILKLNIFQYGDDAILISQRSGEKYDIKIAELRQKVLSFRVADGYTPKSKLAGTDFLTNILQMILQSPILTQIYGKYVPGIISHLAQLGGVRDFDQYSPSADQAQQNILQQGQIQNGIDPTTGQPYPPQPLPQQQLPNQQ